MEIELPSYSTDLSPPDFFLWGYLTDRVFKDRPKTIPELKENIIEEIKGIRQSVLKSVMENIALKIQKCKILNSQRKVPLMINMHQLLGISDARDIQV